MATENNYQITSFTKGMNTDSSYTLIDDGSYTMAKNIRTNATNATNNTNSQNAYGEVKPIEGLLVGTEISYYIPVLGATLENFDDNTKWLPTDKYSTIKSILATGTIRQYGIIIFEYAVQQQDRGNWAVAIFKNKIGETEDYKTDRGDQEDIPNKLYVIFDAKETVTEGILKFSIVTRYENDESIKVYIADTKDPLLTINVADPYLMYKQSILNVLAYPEINFTVPQFIGLVEGDLLAGTVQYAYQLYNRYGVSTDISPLSKRIPIVDGVPVLLAELYETEVVNPHYWYATKNSYTAVPERNMDWKDDESVDVKGVLDSKKTSSGVYLKIHLKNISSNLNRIKIFRIQYLQSGLVPTISIVEDSLIDKIPGSVQAGLGEYFIWYKDCVQSHQLSNISVEEFNSMLGIHVIPTQIESKFDYLFASNIKYENFSKDIHDIGTVTQIQSDVNMIEDFRGSTITPTTKRVEPNTDVFFIETKDGIIRDILYDKEREYGSYSNPYCVVNYRSFRHDEQYRFGIVLYFNDTTSAVYHVGDIVTEKGTSFKLGAFPSTNALYCNPLSININISWDVIKDLIPEGKTLIGYEIVRCLKDFSHLKNISQGVLSRPVLRYSRTSDGTSSETNYFESEPYTPIGMLIMNNYRAGKHYYSPWTRKKKNTDSRGRNPIESWNYQNHDLLQFFSPEFSYMEEYMKTILKGNFLLSPICALKHNYETISDIESNNKYRFLLEKPMYANGNIIGNYKDVSNRWADSISGRALHNNMIFVNIPNKMDEDNNGITPNQDYAEYYINKKFIFDSTSLNRQAILGKRADGWLIPESINYKNYRLMNISGDEGGVNDVISELLQKNIYAYFKLYEIAENILDENEEVIYLTNKSFDIDGIIIADNISWNKFVELKKDNSYSATYLLYLQSVGGRQYVNAVVGQAYDAELVVNSHANPNTRDQYPDDRNLSVGGSCAILKIKDNFDSIIPYTDDIVTYLCNLLNKNYILYGDRRYDTYYSYGDFFEVNGQQDINVNIYSGDCITSTFEMATQYKYFSSISDVNDTTFSVFYSIPIETSILLPYTSGDEFYRKMKTPGVTCMQHDPGLVNGIYTQHNPHFAYNTAYGIEPNARMFTINDEENRKFLETFDYRVINSQQKTNGEYQDSFTKFLSANYIDVDTRYGELTNIRAFGNYLFFWLEHAFGTLSVNERSIIQDANSQNIVLGTGDVLARYDYIDRTSGMHKQEYCDTQSPTMLYWFDDDNQEMRAYSGQGGLNILSKSYNVLNLLNRHSNPNVCPTLFHDPRYNEIVANVISFNKEDLSNPMSIVFNEQVKAFTSVYDIDFDGTVQFYNGTYLTKVEDNKIRIGQWDKWNQDKSYPEGWNDRLLTYIEYVVNKSAITAKVFDNLEIVTENILKPSPLVGKDKDGECSPFANNDYYMTWRTDLNNSEGTPRMTNREGNFRFAIPRADNAKYGSRIRGKYMVVGIENKQPAITDSISYIVTKFRTSWS